MENEYLIEGYRILGDEDILRLGDAVLLDSYEELGWYEVRENTLEGFLRDIQVGMLHNSILAAARKV